MDSSIQARDRAEARLVWTSALQSAASIYVLAFPFCLFIAHFTWLPIGPEPALAASTTGWVAVALVRVAVVTFWFLANFWYITVPVVWLNAILIAKRKRMDADRRLRLIKSRGEICKLTSRQIVGN